MRKGNNNYKEDESFDLKKTFDIFWVGWVENLFVPVGLLIWPQWTRETAVLFFGGETLLFTRAIRNSLIEDDWTRFINKN